MISYCLIGNFNSHLMKNPWSFQIINLAYNVGIVKLILGWLNFVSIMLNCLLLLFSIKINVELLVIDKLWLKIRENLKVLLISSILYRIGSWIGFEWHCVVWSTYGGGVYFLVFILWSWTWRQIYVLWMCGYDYHTIMSSVPSL